MEAHSTFMHFDCGRVKIEGDFHKMSLVRYQRYSFENYLPNIFCDIAALLLSVQSAQFHFPVGSLFLPSLMHLWVLLEFGRTLDLQICPH